MPYKIHWKYGVIAASFWILFVPGLFGEDFRLKSGKVITGEVVEKNSKYIKLNIEGVELKYWVSDIDPDSLPPEYQEPGKEEKAIAAETISAPAAVAFDSAAVMPAPVAVAPVLVEALVSLPEIPARKEFNPLVYGKQYEMQDLKFQQEGSSGPLKLLVTVKNTGTKPLPAIEINAKINSFFTKFYYVDEENPIGAGEARMIDMIDAYTDYLLIRHDTADVQRESGYEIDVFLTSEDNGNVLNRRLVLKKVKIDVEGDKRKVRFKFK